MARYNFPPFRIKRLTEYFAVWIFFIISILENPLFMSVYDYSPNYLFSFFVLCAFKEFLLYLSLTSLTINRLPFTFITLTFFPLDIYSPSVIASSFTPSKSTEPDGLNIVREIPSLFKK